MKREHMTVSKMHMVLEVVDYITDSTICEVMKKPKSSHGL